MITKNEIHYIKSLSKKSVRDTEKVFVAEGSKLVIDIVKAGGIAVSIFALYDWLDENINFMEEYLLPSEEVSTAQMERISGQSSISPVLGVFKQPSLADTFHENILILDDIRDPGNMGTIIRTADWFGIKQLVCSPETVDCFNQKVIQSTMGSIMRVSVSYTPLEEFMVENQHRYTYFGTFMDGHSIQQILYPKNSAFIIGNEAHGISKSVEELVNFRISIPGNQPSDGVVGPESLNASIATAVFLYDWFDKKVR